MIVVTGEEIKKVESAIVAKRLAIKLRIAQRAKVKEITINRNSKLIKTKEKTANRGGSSNSMTSTTN